MDEVSKPAGQTTLITEIPDDKQATRGWKLHIDGTLVDRVKKVTLHNPKFGTLTYGSAQGGAYDVWEFHEIGGGGSVIVPYTGIDEKWHVGLVEQNRPNQGGKVLNLPRGFIQPGERHFKAAERELVEETSYAGVPEPLPGLPVNPNSAFFNTTGEGEGVKFFGIKIDRKYLELVDGLWRFKKGALVPTSSDAAQAKAAEGILGVRFVTLDEAMGVGDMFTVAGVGRLLASKLTKYKSM